MFGKIKRQMQLTNYRMKLRNELQKSEIELVKITKDEAIKEIERRNKQCKK